MGYNQCQSLATVLLGFISLAFQLAFFGGGGGDRFYPSCSLSIHLPCLPVQETFQVHLFFSLDHPLSPLSACPFHSCWLACPPPAWTPFSLRAVTLIFSNSVAPCPSVSSDFPLSVVSHSLRIFSAGLAEKVVWTLSHLLFFWKHF